ncbi:MAG: ATP-binding protein, partial [Erysipelotrichaceae bacterium]|nr:ATP-binding protein [Erysipelotrichaceae bacterium]
YGRSAAPANKLKPLSDLDTSLVLGYSASGSSEFGLDLKNQYKLCLNYSDPSEASQIWAQILKNMDRMKDPILCSICMKGEDSPLGQALGKMNLDASAGGSTEDVDEIISLLREQLNQRFANEGADYPPLFILIDDFNCFFEQITDEQEDFFRKLVSLVDDPMYQTFFITGFDVNSDRILDYLFMELAVKAKNHILGSDCYEKACRQNEALPAVPDYSGSSIWLCQDESSGPVYLG